MHFFRAIPLTLFTVGSFFYVSNAAAQFLLDDVMNREEQRATGISTLNANQKKELEKWLSDNFVLKTTQPVPSQQLFMSLNLNSGQQLELSDGSIYEIAPEDVTLASGWITPIPIIVSTSNNASFPVLLTNSQTGTSIKAKQIQAANSTPIPGS